MKKMMKLFCITLALLLMLSCFPISAIALTDDPLPAASSNGSEAFDESSDRSSLGTGDKITAETEDLRLDPNDVPEMISLQKAEEKGHVARLREQEEDLHTVVYQNRDGNKTTYVFSRPVKYVAANGEVRDKSTALTQSSRVGGAWAMTDNDVKVYFPNNITTGVELVYGDYSMRMAPITSLGESPAYLNEESGEVLYSSVYGKGTILRYKTNLDGVKEDIVLVRNIGVNRFDFRLYVTGLTPHETTAGWILRNAEGETVARFEAITVVDSNGKNVLGEMEITPTQTVGEYTLCITVPESFLNASDTAYPVYVDPTTTVTHTYGYYEDDGSGDVLYHSYRTILDTSVYNTTDAYDAACALYENEEYFHLLGNAIEGSGSGAIVYRFGDFYHADGRFKDLADEQILSAKMYLPVTAGTQMAVTAAPMRYATADPNYGFSGIGEFTGDYPEGVGYDNVTATIGASAGLYELDFTVIAKRWADYNCGNSTQPYHNPANGFVLSSDDETYRYVAYADGASVNGQMLYCVFDTVPIEELDYYLINVTHQKFLYQTGNAAPSVSSSANPSIATCGWCFEYISGDTYYIKPADETQNNYALRASDGGITLEVLPSNPSPSFQWTITDFSSGFLQLWSMSQNAYLCWNGSEFTYSSVDSPVGGTWRGVVSSEYVGVESATIVGNSWFALGNSLTLAINETPSNALYQNDSDYVWSVNNPDFSVSPTGLVTCSSASGGVATVTATHKLTGLSVSHDLKCAIYVVNHYYDRGYSAYYGETSQESYSRLSNMLAIATNIIYEETGVVCQHNIYDGHTYSKVDVCKGTVSSSNLDSNYHGKNCSCDNICNDSLPMLAYFRSQIAPQPNTAYILWTGNYILDTATGWQNRSFMSGPYVLMNCNSISYATTAEDVEVNGTNKKIYSANTDDAPSVTPPSLDERYNTYLYVFIHEFLHIVGARDHYHEILDEGTPNQRCRAGDHCSNVDKCHASDPWPEWCIMVRTKGRDWTDIPDSLICDGCANDIITYLEGN